MIGLIDNLLLVSCETIIRTIDLSIHVSINKLTHVCAVIFYSIYLYVQFDCNNFNIRYWSWNYCGCWHQTCPP
ncbi:hypothetical protein K501DRAFT_203356, partial [Backusella circina FSU 941]